jgi:hypothetical protein
VIFNIVADTICLCGSGAVVDNVKVGLWPTTVDAVVVRMVLWNNNKSCASLRVASFNLQRVTMKSLRCETVGPGADAGTIRPYGYMEAHVHGNTQSIADVAVAANVEQVFDTASRTPSHSAGASSETTGTPAAAAGCCVLQ